MKNQFYENYSSEHLDLIHPEGRNATRRMAAETLVRSLDNFKTHMNSQSRVLDLGCGSGNLAFLCAELGVVDYTGIDLSEENIAICRNDFPRYQFAVSDILAYLQNSNREYDIVLMSHVMEHFSLNEALTILQEIKNRITPGGFFVNIMPNAQAYFHATAVLYSDITHERLYSAISFSHLLRKAGWPSFRHYNYRVGGSAFRRLLHSIALKFFEMLLSALGFDRHSIYTSSIITVASKNNHPYTGKAEAGQYS
ncbi:MAG: class I SAM-dependent methyltransferase [Spirochaetales bacterium]|nr:class I SAM-dependent methyltransferase [Spirochaetales bacterium]